MDVRVERGADRFDLLDAVVPKHSHQLVLDEVDTLDEGLVRGCLRRLPGLERPLVKLKDFERFSGREVKVRTRTAIDKQRRFRGTLRGVVDHSIELEEDGKVVLIPHEDIAQANLVYRFSN